MNWRGCGFGWQYVTAKKTWVMNSQLPTMPPALSASSPHSFQENTVSSILIAMEGVNGHARPLGRYIREKCSPLYAMHNLKLASFKEIIPVPAKTGTIEARSIAELLRLRSLLSKQQAFPDTWPAKDVPRNSFQFFTRPGDEPQGL